MRSHRSSGTRSADTQQILPTQHPTSKPLHRFHSETISKAQSVEDVRVFSNQPSHQHDCYQEDMGMCRFLNVTDSMEIEDGGPATA